MQKKLSIDILEDDILHNWKNVLSILLKDRTTNKNIIWATNDYCIYGMTYKAENEIKLKQITGKNTNIIQPRIKKNKENQFNRMKEKAEVFTPSWICNKQNNLIDEKWFNKPNQFNIEDGEKWITNTAKIEFDKKGKWKDYILNLRMEIACGEAPYIVSRYDTVTGKIIPVEDRIGLLDRKLRVINENVDDEAKWIKWVKKAYKSIYAFEYQGDNLLLARENLLYTFIENYWYKFYKIPLEKDIKRIAQIISWNVWQMDGIKYIVPFCDKDTLYKQMSFFINIPFNVNYCKIKDWTKSKNNVIEYRDLIGG